VHLSWSSDLRLYNNDMLKMRSFLLCTDDNIVKTIHKIFYKCFLLPSQYLKPQIRLTINVHDTIFLELHVFVYIFCNKNLYIQTGFQALKTRLPCNVNDTA